MKREGSDMLAWLIDNKEWIFSGIGVTVIGGIIGMCFKNKSGTNQTQKSGRNSTNIQTTGNVEINNVKRR